jgi:superoxide dismutase, Cu-Zn family
MRHIVSLLVLGLAGAGLAACASTSPGDVRASDPLPPVSTGAERAQAILAPASGSLVSGTLALAAMGDGVHITGELGGFRPGSSHGFHIHETGDCSAADASSAGDHFNPTGAPHGRAGSGAHHLGDMDNLVADAQGRARVDVHVRGVSLGTGLANDVAGRALVAHAVPDDYRSQPAGNAGARVACGVIVVR